MSFEKFLGNAVLRSFSFSTKRHADEYFGQSFTSQDQYSGLGLNVLLPLLQAKEMSIKSRSLHRARLSKPQDPEIRAWDNLRLRQVSSDASVQLVKPLASTPKKTFEE